MKSRCLTLSLIALFVLLTGALPAQAAVRVTPVPEGLPFMAEGFSHATLALFNEGERTQGRPIIRLFDYNNDLIYTLEDCPVALAAGEGRPVTLPIFVPETGASLSLDFVQGDEGERVAPSFSFNKDLIPLPSPYENQGQPVPPRNLTAYQFNHAVGLYLKAPYAPSIDFSCVSGLLLLYVLAAGPGLFLLLRRFKRLELSWILLPLLAVLTSLVIYGGVVMERGTGLDHESLSLTVVDRGGNSTYTEWIFLQSSNEFSGTIMASPLTSGAGGEILTSTTQPFPPYRVIRRNDSLTITDLDFYPWSSRVLGLRGQGPVFSPPELIEPPDETSAPVTALLRYSEGPELKEAFLLFNGRRVPLGDLAPSADPIRISGTSEPIPRSFSAYNPEWSGDRARDAVRLLIGFGGSTGLAPQNLYLAGWAEPGITTEISPAPTRETKRSLVAFLLLAGADPDVPPTGGKR